MTLKSREVRFLGNGNVWVGDGHYRGWRVTCCKCGDTKTVSSHHRSCLPPSMIVKKLAQAGWYIGTNETQDMCGPCRRRKPVSKEVPSKSGAPAGDMNMLRRLHKLLTEGRADEARMVIEKAIGMTPERGAGDSDFEAWFSNVHRGNAA